MSANHTADRPAAALADDERLVRLPEIASDVGITQRGLRKWIAAGKFPVPDGNLYGRNFWKLATYRQWKADALAGKYLRHSTLGNSISAA